MRYNYGKNKASLPCIFCWQLGKKRVRMVSFQLGAFQCNHDLCAVINTLSHEVVPCGNNNLSSDCPMTQTHDV